MVKNGVEWPDTCGISAALADGFAKLGSVNINFSDEDNSDSKDRTLPREGPSFDDLPAPKSDSEWENRRTDVYKDVWWLIVHSSLAKGDSILLNLKGKLASFEPFRREPGFFSDLEAKLRACGQSVSTLGNDGIFELGVLAGVLLILAHPKDHAYHSAVRGIFTTVPEARLDKPRHMAEYWGLSGYSHEAQASFEEAGKGERFAWVNSTNCYIIEQTLIALARGRVVGTYDRTTGEPRPRGPCDDMVEHMDRHSKASKENRVPQHNPWIQFMGRNEQRVISYLTLLDPKIGHQTGNRETDNTKTELQKMARQSHEMTVKGTRAAVREHRQQMAQPGLTEAHHHPDEQQQPPAAAMAALDVNSWLPAHHQAFLGGRNPKPSRPRRGSSSSQRRRGRGGGGGGGGGGSGSGGAQPSSGPAPSSSSSSADPAATAAVQPQSRPPPALPRSLKALPWRELGLSGSDECPCCMEPFSVTVDAVRMPDCGHPACALCLRFWLAKQPRGDPLACFICRRVYIAIPANGALRR